METGSLKKLIELGSKPRRGVPGVILAHFSEITEARELGWTWRDIAGAMGRSGEEKAMSTAFSRIKKRIDSGKLKVPGKDQQYSRKEEKKEEKEAMPDATAKTQKESTVFRSEDKPKGGRIGPPKPIGRGRFELGKDIPDDEL